MKPAMQLLGRRFCRLVVQERLPNKDGYTYWKCLCDCGKTANVIGRALTKGNTRSCGCLYLDAMRVVSVTHGRSRSRVYNIWCGMRNRCQNPRNSNFDRYGGRGIKVCDRWQTFENFLADMGDPAPGLTLERQDNDGDYQPGNCQWATRKQQGRNTSSTLLVSFLGRSMPLVEACELANKKHQNVYMRMRRGSTFEEAIQ